MFDVVFLSYTEPFKEENWQEVSRLLPWAKRIDGVAGIPNAHIEAAKAVRTEMFFVIDADSKIIDFPLRFQPSRANRSAVHVWRSTNPINGLSYGYGGVKLFPRQQVLEIDPEQIIDFTTSVGSHFVNIETIASETRFNVGPFETWRSAFREAAKLSSSVIKDHNPVLNQQRLEIWCSQGQDQEYGEYAISGAHAGKLFGEQNSIDNETMKLINNFDWLLERYNAECKLHSHSSY